MINEQPLDVARLQPSTILRKQQAIEGITVYGSSGYDMPHFTRNNISPVSSRDCSMS